MIEFKIVLFSKAESLLGLHIDQGEYEKGPNKWVPFFRIRLGFILLTLDFTKYTISKS
jgi:hypothetical protein